jgi:hypothetical protein
MRISSIKRNKGSVKVNGITQKFLNIVGKGFQYNQADDLVMVRERERFYKSLTLEEHVELVNGLDEYAKGNKTSVL